MNYLRPRVLALTGAALLATLPAAADPPSPAPRGTPSDRALGAGSPATTPASPDAPLPVAPLGPIAAPPAGPELQDAYELPVKRRSTGAMVGGVVGVSVGTALVFSLVGAATIQKCSFDNATESVVCGADSALVVGVTVAGLAAFAIGLPLLIYGARQVPVSASGGAAAGSVLPAWAGAPGGAGWRWRF